MNNLIGNTPLIRINYRYKNVFKYVYAKLEYFNFTGSVKDRIVYYILEDAKKKGVLDKCNVLVEATSGNTGISLAALGALYKKPVHIFMPDWVSNERIKLLKLYGAHIHLVSKEEGGFLKAIELAKEYSSEKHGFYLDQFNNNLNTMCHYKNLGHEIVDKLLNIRGFINGVGTGGTLMGVGKRILEDNPNAKIIAVEPQEMPILSNGKIVRQHKIDGISDEFIPSLVDLSIIDKITLISDMDAINMSKIFSRKLGLGIGVSSCANFLASALEEDNGFVTIFADDNKKYLSVLNDEYNDKNNFISNNIKLIDIEVIL